MGVEKLNNEERIRFKTASELTSKYAVIQNGDYLDVYTLLDSLGFDGASKVEFVGGIPECELGEEINDWDIEYYRSVMSKETFAALTSPMLIGEP